MTSRSEPRILQFCHGYDGPFLDCARQYASLFQGRGYQVTTVFLTGAADPQVAAGCASDEVLFLAFSSKAVRGLKLGAIRALRRIAAERNFAFCIAHRFKPIYVALLGTGLPVIGVHHAFGDYERKGRRLFANLFSKRLSLLGVSDAVRDDMRRCLPQWPAERIQTLYNRIDIDALQAALVPRAEARQALGLDAQAWIVGNVGRLHPTKTRQPCCVVLLRRCQGCQRAPVWRFSARAGWRPSSRLRPPSWALPGKWTSWARCRMHGAISRRSTCLP
ncbi:hypothetical protein PPTS312_00370 [Pseudomonas putida]|uniref:Glycosyltransferase subfamily 4-like N-terminal domain-containing protein n=1 Tax=Pseudomonas putida TaxID=303 RepID=A0A7U6LXH6_PSEPU|nr:hypothetical protein PPTS312_00370 [Pseudomonas putida]